MGTVRLGGVLWPWITLLMLSHMIVIIRDQNR